MGGAVGEGRAGIGAFLRERRVGAGLSLSELARRAELGKATLSRWEAGKAEPDVEPLLQALAVLGAGAEEVARALGMLRAPRGARALREFDRDQGRDLAEIGVAAPVFGSALRAIRARAGLSPEQLARQLGVARSTVGLWETGQRVPGRAMVGLIADACGASPSELRGLAERRLPVPLGPANVDRLSEWLTGLVDRLATERHVDEVEAAGFEAEAWRLAQKDERGAAVLGQYYNVRAGAHCETFAVAEVRRYAARARDLPYWQAAPLVSHIPDACLAWVRYGIHGIAGIERDLPRLEAAFHRPMGGYERWSLHLFLARFYAEQGRRGRMLEALAEAEREAAGDPGRLALHSTYVADCWETAGDPERALRLLPEESPNVWAVPGHLETTRLAALTRLGERDAATRALARVRAWGERSGIVTVEARRAISRFHTRFVAPTAAGPDRSDSRAVPPF